MKKIILALAGTVTFLLSAAQCSIIEVPLSQRTASSSLIVEGKVTGKQSYWNANSSMIYTINTVEVYKIFKGALTSSTIEVLSEGGIVGDRMIRVEPSLELNTGDIGVFTLAPVTHVRNVPAHLAGPPQYEAYASVQGFLKYDLQTQTATDPFHTYQDIETDVYPAVLSPGQRTYQEVQPFNVHNANHLQNPSVQAPSISGFSPSTVTAGTGTVLTITGSGFGATQGSGTVGFKNADDGGATYINPLATQILSWSNTQITVEVPSEAGSGTIQVTQGSTTTSGSSLTVSYAHLNVSFDPGSGVTAYQTDHVDDNGSGGYTWHMNTAFDADASAKASFLRAFDSWRCNTGINWTIGSTTSINDAVSDGTNVICFDNTAPLSAGILGVCYSYWSGCASGPTIVWYVNELDIIFDEGSNITPLTWQYGPSLPSINQYDFESVAVHELGHGHQLGHVISPGAIMHYALSNGSSNRTPGVNDLAGANFVQAKSIVANVCGPGPMTSYSCGAAPVADFSGSPTTLCAGGSVSFSDLSTNTPTSWSWTFTGGSPSSSASQNPTVTYSAAGTYAVSLTATNASGSDTKTVSGYITVNANPGASGTVTNVSCNGGNTGAIDLTPSGGQSPYTFSWTPSGQTTEDRTGLAAGSYTVTVTDANTCTVTATFSVTQPSVISTSVSAQTNVLCNGGSNGSATVSASGGSGGYTYSWVPAGGTAATATGLGAGTYTCTITDSNGCGHTQTVVITEPTALSVSMSKTDETCAGNDGTATATPSGGTSPYTYSWTPTSQVTQTAVNLAGGTYTCTVTDANNCTIADNITVNTAVCGSPPVADFSGSPLSVCPGATVAFTDLSTNTPTSWSWTFTGGTPSSSASQNPSIVYNTPGSYAVSLTVTNASGSDTKTVNGYITVNSNPSASTSTVDVTCNGGTDGSSIANASGGSGGYTYSWAPSGGSAATASGLSAGNYTCTVTDASGCTTTATASITEPAPVTVNVFANNNPICNGDVVTLTASGAVSYSWMPGSLTGSTQVLSPTSTTTYTVTGTDGNGCTGTGNLTLTVNNCNNNTTTLLPSYCGATDLNLSQWLYNYAVPGATNYRYVLTNTVTGSVHLRVKGNSNPNMPLSWIPGLVYGESYFVQVAAFVGGSWGSWGPSCQISLQADPLGTRLTSASCNATGLTENSYIYCNGVAGATNYYFTLNGASYSQSQAKTVPYIRLGTFTGLTPNETYTVTVLAYSGGMWSSYVTTPVCTITMGSVLRMAYDSTEEAGTNFVSSLYPNPIGTGVSPTVKIEHADGQQALIRVLDLSGREIAAYEANVEGDEFTTTFAAFPELSQGIYIMQVSIADRVENMKFVVE